MLKHIVFFRMKAEADNRAGDQNQALLKERLEALPATIKEIRSFEVGDDVSRSPASWDLALYSAFDSTEDLEAYRVHPDHQAVVELVGRVTSERAVVDYWDR
ncbi:MAG: Dabb family protein [Opitutales bacterium]|nr:Dabb family protein [Opitutales bacterium]